MKEQLAKILISAFALLLSFIFKIEIVRNILLGLSIVVLLENSCVEAYKKIKQKDFLNEYVFITFASVLLILTEHFVVLLEALLFFSLKEYIYFKALKENETKQIKNIINENKIVTLKVASGLIKIPLKEVKEGDILYLEKGDINEIESIALEDTSYLTVGKKKKVKVIASTYIPSGVVLETPCYMKVKRNWNDTSLFHMKTLLQKTNENEEIKSVHKIEVKLNYFLFLISILYAVLMILYLKKDILEVLFTVSSLIFLIATETIMKYENKILYTYLIKLLKEDIYLTKENLLELLTKIKIVIFSKEGVLTTGKLELSKVIPVYQTKEEILTKAVYAEYGSTHPIANALSSYYPVNINQDKIEYIEDIKGCGRRAIIDSEEIYIGNATLFDSLEITYPKIDFLGPSCMIAINKTYAGTFVFANNTKEDAYMVGPLLREEKIDKIILISSGDKEQIKKIGSYLSMSESYASLTLEEKEKVLDMYQKEGKILYIDAYHLENVLRKKADLTILLGSDRETNEADIIMPNMDANDIVTVRKLATSLTKSRKKLRIFFTVLKVVLFLLVMLKLISIDFVALIYLLLLFSFIVYTNLLK
jgi:Cd2+/Zn2+-exporting ATPase